MQPHSLSHLQFERRGFPAHLMAESSDRSIYFRWLIPATSFRLPVALIPLAIEYVIGTGANFRFASLVVGALAVGELSVVGIVATRLDNYSAHFQARSTLALLALVDVALVMASLVHVLLWLSLPAALLSGALTALGSGKLRHTLTHRLQPGSLQRYLSWDAVALEVAYLLAPLLVAIQVTLLGTHGLLATPAILALICPLLLGPDSSRDAKSEGSGRVTLRSWLWALSAAEGIAEGMVVVSIVPIATQLIHRAAFAALAMALLSVGSILGGVLYAHHATHSANLEPLKRIALSLLGLSICLVASGLGDHSELALGSILFIFGSFIAPLNGLRTYAVTHRFEPRLHASAFSMVYSSYSIGSVSAAISFAVLDRLITLSEILLAASFATAMIAIAYGIASILQTPG